MPTPAELKDREDRLKADEVNWQARRTQLERIIQKHNLTLDELVPKLEHLTGLITEKSAEYDQISAKLRRLSTEVGVKEQQVDHIDGKIRTSQTILADLDAVISSKRLQIETGLTEYADKRKREIQAEQRADEEAAQKAREALGALQSQVTAKREELDDVRQEAATVRTEQARDLAIHEGEIKQLIDQRLPLEVDIKALTAEVVKLQRIRETTIAETAKAKQQFDGFIDYERRARKVLDTKDRELQDKAQEIAQANRHLLAKTSYLTDL